MAILVSSDLEKNVGNLRNLNLVSMFNRSETLFKVRHCNTVNFSNIFRLICTALCKMNISYKSCSYTGQFLIWQKQAQGIKIVIKKKGWRSFTKLLDPDPEVAKHRKIKRYFYERKRIRFWLWIWLKIEKMFRTIFQ